MGEIQLYGDFLTLERVSSVDVLLLSQEDFTTWIVAKDSVPLLEEAWDETYEERKVKFIGVETIWERLPIMLSRIMPNGRTRRTRNLPPMVSPRWIILHLLVSMMLLRLEMEVKKDWIMPNGRRRKP